MDNILNRAGIKKYSERFTHKVLDKFFNKKERISGEEIKNLTSIKQVNLFVIKGLFEAWRQETSKLQSPYFDYNSSEVKEALDNFMNVLSKNISITRESFEPLLTRATEESILIIFSPFDFYVHFTDHTEGEVSLENLGQIGRYIRVNQNIFNALLAKVQIAKLNKIDVQKYSELLNEVLHEIATGPEDIDEYFDAFNEVEPLFEKDIYGEAPTPESPQLTIEEPAATEQSSINDVHANDAPSIAEAGQKLESIKGSLSINQRFMFQNNLFNGDESLMEKTLDFVDNCSSKKEAVDHLLEKFPFWNVEGEEFEELVELINRKFG